MKDSFQRRADTEKNQAGDYYSGPDRYYDQMTESTVVKLFSGGYYASKNKGEVVVTILGSCISCCLYDPLMKVGGMNHFLIPGVEDAHSKTSSARYGIHAMELLINNLIKYGASKDRLVAKVFGGANMLDTSHQIGAKNIVFVKDFLKNEGIKLVSEDVGGNTPRRVHFEPDTGKVRIRKLRRVEDLKIIEKEKQYAAKVIEKPKEEDDDITLF